jgi:hypothetical protein
MRANAALTSTRCAFGTTHAVACTHQLARASWWRVLIAPAMTFKLTSARCTRLLFKLAQIPFGPKVGKAIARGIALKV